ncbi:echinoderm microtubule-associated protein-like 2 isoform X5 [Ruditapes philippinarum]|uniref:echinoderm microtubule-associated protein-like 2 isoform X5 n=1 Tax=Ruditapes philippinarum TaxID=129788 RepID=UPI00295BEA30|nr:echinoderm microtubule-associated protein-like 2 isoform X5 [Ruditapes philippinarum]
MDEVYETRKLLEIFPSKRSIRFCTEQLDGLLSQDQEELSERVAHLEKRVREQENEIVCLKGALADVTRRLGQMETLSKSQNSILPSRPFKTPAPRRTERPKSQVIESSNFTPRSSAPNSARQTPRGASANTMKKWGSTEDTQKTPRPHSSSQLTQSKRLSTSHGSLHIKPAKGIKEPTWNNADGYLRMHLKGRPVCLFAPDEGYEDYNVKAEQDCPNATLKLEWVYGYRGRDCRSNLYTVATGEICYFSAAIVVLHNFESNSQRFYDQHTDDIKCIAVHPDQVTVATGQVAGHEKKEGKLVFPDCKKPHVRVWEVIKLQTLHVIGEGEFQRGVSCVAFSIFDGGHSLLAVDEGNDHTMSVWNLQGKVKKLAECKSSGDPVTQCEFHPTEENSIVCCGKSQISFWTFIKEEKKLDKKMGIFGKNDKPKVVICFCYTQDGDVVSGDSNGNIFLWEKGANKISKAETGVHEGGVFSLYTTKDGNILSGGGKDRKILEWSKDLQRTGNSYEVPEEFGGVRMISSGPGSLIIVGTIRNCILQASSDLVFTPMVEGHKEEFWGLDTLPDTYQFLTCGSDKYIYMWDAQAHTALWRKQIADEAHCCCIHPNNKVAAIGTTSGKIVILDLENSDHEIVAVYTDGKEQHECIQYSPDGEMLASGNRDNGIYIYKVEEEGRKCHKIGKCSGHSSFVTHIDWSCNGKYLRSNSGDYEVLYWTAKNCKQETQKDDVRNLDWATNNCTLSFASVGVWPDGADGTDINNCAVSHQDDSKRERLIVSADDFGKVNLYSYPSIQPRAVGHSYGGHSSHVTMAKFLFDNSRVISAGGRDATVMQWEVIY